MKMWVIGGAAGALALLVAVMLWQRAELRAVRLERDQWAERAEDAELRIEVAEAARIAYEAAVARMAAERDRALAVEDKITRDEGANAPASDYLRRAVDAAGGL